MTGTWNLRYAPHLGYLPPEFEPLFPNIVKSIDPWDHVAFAAEQGFAGVLYPWAASRPDEEVARFQGALRHFGLAAGCTVFAPLEAAFTPLWTQGGDNAWETVKSHLDRSIPLARKLGSTVVAVIIKGEDESDLQAQESAAVDLLKQAGDLAAGADLIIGVEPMIALPGMLLTTTAQTVALLEQVGHPAVRMIFDTAHVQMMDEDVLAAYATAREHIGLIQLADMPGRGEPGSGTIDFATLLAQAQRDGNAGGLIELEHGWTESAVAVERAGIEALRRIDTNLQNRYQS